MAQRVGAKRQGALRMADRIMPRKGKRTGSDATTDTDTFTDTDTPKKKRRTGSRERPWKTQEAVE